MCKENKSDHTENIIKQKEPPSEIPLVDTYSLNKKNVHVPKNNNETDN